MRFSFKFFACLLTFLIIPAIAAAETAYVSDQLEITLRSGKSLEHKILKTINAGTPLEVLERNEGDQYVKVKLQSGEEGYVLARYLTNETPKPIIIARLQRQIEKLKEQVDQAKAGRAEASQEMKTIQEAQTQKEAELNGKIKELHQSLAKTTEELQNAKIKYDTLVKQSGEVIKITSERDKLLNSNKELTAKVQFLDDENSTLKSSKVIRWFLAGAGVLFFGWILGKASRKKQRGLY